MILRGLVPYRCYSLSFRGIRRCGQHLLEVDDFNEEEDKDQSDQRKSTSMTQVPLQNSDQDKSIKVAEFSQRKHSQEGSENSVELSSCKGNQEEFTRTVQLLPRKSEKSKCSPGGEITLKTAFNIFGSKILPNDTGIEAEVKVRRNFIYPY